MNTNQPVYCPPQKCTSEEVSLRVTVPLWYNPGRTNVCVYVCVSSYVCVCVCSCASTRTSCPLLYL